MRLDLFTILALLSLAWGGAVLALAAPGVEGELQILAASGWAAALSLVASLAITPLRRLTRHPFSRARRTLGLTAALWALGHATLASATYLQDTLPSVWERPALRMGALSLLILVLLAVTSHPEAQRRLGARWRVLHRLAYAAGILAVLHVVQGRAKMAAAMALALTVVVLLALRVLPRAPVSSRGQPRGDRPLDFGETGRHGCRCSFR